MYYPSGSYGTAPFGSPLASAPMAGASMAGPAPLPYGGPAARPPVRYVDEPQRPTSISGKPYLTEDDDEPTRFWESFVQDRWTQHYYIRKAPENPRPNTSLRMLGTPSEGEELRVTGWWIDLDAPRCSYQWQASYANENRFSDIHGATYQTFRTSAAHANNYIRCVVTHEGEKNHVDSQLIAARPAPVAVARAPAPPPETEIMSVNVQGGPYHTNHLICKVTWSPPTNPEPRGQCVWSRTEVDTSNGTYNNIENATNMSYVPTADDLHCQLRVTYTHIRDDNTTKSYVADVPPHFLHIDPQIAEKVAHYVGAEKEATFDVTDANSGEPRAIYANPKFVRITDSNKKQLGKGEYTNKLRLNLSYVDPAAFDILIEGRRFNFKTTDIVQRDVIALTIRSFLGSAVLQMDKSHSLHRVSSLSDLHPPSN